MRNLNLLIIAALLIALFGFAFVFHESNVPSLVQAQVMNDTGWTSAGISSVVNASNQFAIDFYSELKDENQGKNIFFSPYSISTALAMAYEGAHGQTAEEMQSVFHFPVDDSMRRSSYAAVYNELNPKNPDYQLSTANALWVQAGFPILKDYTNTVQEFYAGKANDVDFSGNNEQARNTINSWVADQTNNKIKDLFPPGSLDSLTRVVLTNAIYFKGEWVTQFDKSLTTDQDFTVDSRTTISVPMMQRTDDRSIYNYTETDKVQVLEMPYKGDRLSMLVLLTKNESLDSLENSLTLENLDSWRSSMTSQRVDIYMPKFTFTSKYTLNDDLKGMGMTSAFNLNTADFSGIDGRTDLYIQTIVHQAYISVDEQGTEAAAATGVAIGAMSIITHPVFRADHPFMFIIQDRETGNILFLGRVVNPTSQ